MQTTTTRRIRRWTTAAALTVAPLATLWAPGAHAVPNGPGEIAPAPKPSISIGDAAVTEGDAGTKLMHFSVTLSKSSGQKIVANVQTVGAVGSPATANVDYVSKVAVLEFAPGVTARNFSVSVKGDTQFEANEKLGASIGNVSNATVGKQIGKGTIVNDDDAVIVNPPGPDPQPEPPAPQPPAPGEPDPEPAGPAGSDGGAGGGSTGDVPGATPTAGLGGGGGEQALGLDGAVEVAPAKDDGLTAWLVVLTALAAGAFALLIVLRPRRRRET